MFISFFDDESGAITVDWVVLTASIVGIAIAVLLIISGGIRSASSSASSDVSSSESVSGLIDGVVAVVEPDPTPSTYTLPGNLSEFTSVRDDGDHQHYYDDDENTFRVESGVMTEGLGGGPEIATVGIDGSITPI